MLKMRSEIEIRKQIAKLQKKSYKGEPYSEIKRIILKTTKHALEWTIEEEGSLLNC